MSSLAKLRVRVLSLIHIFFLANTADAVSQIVRWIINLAPFGIMGLVYTNVSGNGLAIFTQYGKLLALLVGTCLLYTSRCDRNVHHLQDH